MAGLKGLVVLAFMGSVGMTLVILSCATPSLGAVWWPFFVVIFYFLAPVPVLFANRYSETLQMSTSTTPKDVALFFTAGIVISAYGLPIILARAPILEPVIHTGACALVLMGNTVVFLTILGFFYSFSSENNASGYF
ncbi:PREDICTED: leptin receptor gene-related protein-like [Rhagoletis zephyria]|uniref:leptin receptor gene-related protein-like n=1 Tax=Rhagoletis zephyria TaxID=28612 RepID=UPI0008115AD2|nr:PREDICTED: leptin receptor gene-related protein-like [Rhagoletis zephyria]